MSDSASSFSELKDNESTSGSTSIPINTSLTHADKPLPTTVDKPASVKNATFSSDYSTLFVPSPHPAYSVDWFVFYLKQTRVLIILALLIYTLILVIWVASLGKASKVAAASTGGIVCPQWAAAELVPNIINACPPARAEVFYAGSASSGGIRINGNSVSQEDVSLAPMAIFVPQSANSYYYTAVFLDTDFPNRQTPSLRSRLSGVLTNLRLGDSVDTSSGQWIMQYEPPTSVDREAHRYVWLIYRHSTATNNLQVPVQLVQFNVEDWFASYWSQRPTLAAAAYFEAAGK